MPRRGCVAVARRRPQAWADLPLAERLAADDHTRPLILWLMVFGHLRPGYDYLVARKLPSLWREVAGSPMEDDLGRYVTAAAELGFTRGTARACASQVVARLLIQTGRPLQQLRDSDLDGLIEALRARRAAGGRGWKHYRAALQATRTVLFHLGVLAAPSAPVTDDPAARWRRRLCGVPAPLLPPLIAYLQLLVGTHRQRTIDHIVSRLAHFGRHLATVDPALDSFTALERQRHIETYLTAVAAATRRDGAPIAISERRARIITVNRFLADITDWGWPDAPARQLLFPRDIPRLPRPLPRYLPRHAKALRCIQV